MVTCTVARLGLRLAAHRPTSIPPPHKLAFFTPTTTTPSKRSLSSTAIISSTTPRLARSKFSALAANPPTATTTPSSFFTPSLCRVRNASTTASRTADPTPSTTPGADNPPASAVVLDWNTFFRLRQSRRRYSLTSSIIGTIASTAGMMYFIVEYPDKSEYLVNLIPMDAFISTGIAVFASMFVGWLLAPVFGNGLWRIVYRGNLPEFTIKERAFFERIKKHRVNPSGAGANNPVPDYYGERIGSVRGYRRWLKDQRAFNRKRAGGFPGI